MCVLVYMREMNEFATIYGSVNCNTTTLNISAVYFCIFRYINKTETFKMLIISFTKHTHTSIPLVIRKKYNFGTSEIP